MNSRKNTAFTLLEVVVVIGLIALMAIFVVGIMIANNRFFNNQTGEITAISGTRQIADRILEYGRLAVSVASSYTYNTVDYSSGATSVIFQIPSINSAGQVLTTYDYVIITKDSVNPLRLLLFLVPDAASARVPRNVELTNKLGDVLFTYDPNAASADAVNYSIQINMGGPSGAAETVEGRVTLRKK